MPVVPLKQDSEITTLLRELLRESLAGEINGIILVVDYEQYAPWHTSLGTFSNDGFDGVIYAGLLHGYAHGFLFPEDEDDE
jgi:hypothetical protein